MLSFLGVQMTGGRCGSPVHSLGSAPRPPSTRARDSFLCLFLHYWSNAYQDGNAPSGKSVDFASLYLPRPLARGPLRHSFSLLRLTFLFRSFPYTALATALYSFSRLFFPCHPQNAGSLQGSRLVLPFSFHSLLWLHV